MKIDFVGKKAIMASEKHFNGELNEDMMSLLVSKVIRNATHVGQSDRSNGSHSPAKIVWGDYNNRTYAVVLDTNNIKKGIATVISFYDINENTREAKAIRFGMKKVR